MVGFKSAKGSGLEWLPTGIQTGFSNFRFIGERFHSFPVLRRLLPRIMSGNSWQCRAGSYAPG